MNRTPKLHKNYRLLLNIFWLIFRGLYDLCFKREFNTAFNVHFVYDGMQEWMLWYEEGASLSLLPSVLIIYTGEQMPRGCNNLCLILWYDSVEVMHLFMKCWRLDKTVEMNKSFHWNKHISLYRNIMIRWVWSGMNSLAFMSRFVALMVVLFL